MKFYLLKCNGCGAALADNVSLCPWCNQVSDHTALVTGRDDGIKESKRGLVITDGAHLHIGADESLRGQNRPCPWCSKVIDAAETICPSCANRVIIEALHIRQSLVIDGGTLTVSGGGRLQIGGASAADKKLLQAAKKNDSEQVRQLVIEGANPGYEFNAGTALWQAVEAGSEDAARALIALGADQSVSKGGVKLAELARQRGLETLAAYIEKATA